MTVTMTITMTVTTLINYQREDDVIRDRDNVLIVYFRVVFIY